jgi:hypothetical protein
MNLESIQDHESEEDQEELFHILIWGGVGSLKSVSHDDSAMNCDQSTMNEETYYLRTISQRCNDILCEWHVYSFILHHMIRNLSSQKWLIFVERLNVLWTLRWLLLNKIKKSRVRSNKQTKYGGNSKLKNPPHPMMRTRRRGFCSPAIRDASGTIEYHCN